ncbi:replication initiation protein [Helicobacter monodelphidis]|uniref:replication initiation protein n=1 Tax=Helicobacter sp. 15-1451 TaxID=2004995 RepID=UPI0015EC0732|nr:replication initiation protein [Helicobacter sp. 15-1451]
MNEVVKYHNDFNKLNLNGFSELQQNILFGLIFAIKDKKETIMLDYGQIKEFTKNSKLTGQELWKQAQELEKNLSKLDFTIIKPCEDSKIFERATYNLFKKFSLFYSTSDNNPDNPNKSLGQIEVKINEEFAYLINELTANFTRFELAEFIALSGKYTKTLYRLLKQFRSTGLLHIEWKEFLRVMDIPESYKICDIERQILKPAIKELTAPRTLFDIKRTPFESLSYTKIKGKGRGRGGNVIGIEFYFTPETTNEIEQRANKRNLEIIAQNIWCEEARNKLKRLRDIKQKTEEPTTNQVTTEIEDELEVDNYLYRNLRMKNRFDEYDTLKIQNISKDESGNIIVTLRNADDNHISEMIFKDLKHLENVFNRYAI